MSFKFSLIFGYISINSFIIFPLFMHKFFSTYLYKTRFCLCKLAVNWSTDSHTLSVYIVTFSFSVSSVPFFFNRNTCKHDLFWRHLSRAKKCVKMLFSWGNKAAYLTCIWAENQYSGLRMESSRFKGGEPNYPSWIYFFRNGLYFRSSYKSP